MPNPPDPSNVVEVYIDESSQNNHRFLVLGAIVNCQSESQQVLDLVAKARLPELPNGEMKWTKVSKTKLPAYKRVIDAVFENPKLVHFHSLFVDTSQFDHTKFNEGDREIGFNKEIYQLAMKMGRLYKTGYFHIYPDERNTNQLPEDLRLILNRGARKAGDKRDWPYRRCQFRNSKKTLTLQVADVIAGAVAFKLNGHDRAKDASPAKIELANYILKKAGIADVSKGTAISGTFTVWPRKLK